MSEGKKIIIVITIFFAIAILSGIASAQMRQQCAGTNQFAIVQITAIGDINIKPCPNRVVNISGISVIKGTANVNQGGLSVNVPSASVTANSIIQVVARTNDLTCSVKNYVPAAGSFVINMTAACTALTSIGYIVTN